MEPGEDPADGSAGQSYATSVCGADPEAAGAGPAAGTEGVRGVDRFRIPVVPPTVNKTVRFPNDVVAGVEEAIRGKECTFSAFVIEAVRQALRELEGEG